MYTINELTKRIDDFIDNEIINKTNTPRELYDPIKYTLSNGGKRLRPALTLMAANLFTNDIDKILWPATGLEIFHNFTLLHDDIMDKSDLRRNKPTVHKKWDENTGILSGDAMLIKAYQFMIAQRFEQQTTILEVFNKTAMEVCQGQQYDMNFEKKDKISINDYLEMIRLKTSVLIAASLKIGAICAGATQNEQEKLYNFGLNLGLAFQIQDDYLDVYGNTEVFGKETGTDIVNNKKTFLLISALESANDKEYDTIKYWINKPDFDKQEKITEIKKIYENLKIAEKTKEKILELHQIAIQHLSEIIIDNDKKSELLNLAQKMLYREN